jgi:hypothetical protein
MAGGSGQARSAWPPPRGAGASPSAAKSCQGSTVTATQAIFLLRRKRKFGELDLPHETSTRGSFLVCEMRSVSVGRQIGVGVGFGTSSSCAARTGRPKSAPPSARLHTRSVGHTYVLQICGRNLTAAKRSCRHKLSSSQATSGCSSNRCEGWLPFLQHPMHNIELASALQSRHLCPESPVWNSTVQRLLGLAMGQE